MRFADMIRDNKFSLLVSLPSNNLEYAKAALEGGAQAIKVHCNVWHRASGHTFGTYEENREFLRELIDLCGDVPVGLMPGTSEAFITEENRRELEEMGLSYVSAYSHHLPCFMMESEKLTNAVAIDFTYSNSTLDAVRDSEIEVLECSIVRGKEYGTDLSYGDVLRYAEIAQKSGKPCVVPTQRKIRPCEVRHLYRAGCKALMIGAVVMGQEPTAEEVRTVTSAFRAAVDAL